MVDSNRSLSFESLCVVVLWFWHSQEKSPLLIRQSGIFSVPARRLCSWCPPVRMGASGRIVPYIKARRPPLGAMELMSWDRDRSTPEVIDMNGDLPTAWNQHRVWKDNIFLPGNITYFRYRLNNSRFGCWQTWCSWELFLLLMHCGCLQINLTVWVDREIGYSEALFFQILACSQYRMMFNTGSNDIVLPLTGVRALCLEWQGYPTPVPRW